MQSWFYLDLLSGYSTIYVRNAQYIMTYSYNIASFDATQKMMIFDILGAEIIPTVYNTNDFAMILSSHYLTCNIRKWLRAEQIQYFVIYFRWIWSDTVKRFSEHRQCL